WWVVGPYSPAFRRTNPPETNPDPFQPVAAGPRVRSITDAWPTERHWEPVHVNADGYLNLREPFDGARNISAYALMRVYCPEKRPATILLGSSGPLRLWVNGQLEYEYDKSRKARPDED